MQYYVLKCSVNSKHAQGSSLPQSLGDTQAQRGCAAHWGSILPRWGPFGFQNRYSALPIFSFCILFRLPPQGSASMSHYPSLLGNLFSLEGKSLTGNSPCSWDIIYSLYILCIMNIHIHINYINYITYN